MAITLDNAPSTQQLALSASSLTYSFTRAAGNGVVFVSVIISDVSAVITGATLGGEAMTLINQRGPSTLGTITLYQFRLINPSTSGAQNIVITANGSATAIAATTFSFSGNILTAINTDDFDVTANTIVSTLSVADQSFCVGTATGTSTDIQPGTGTTSTTSNNPGIGYNGPRSGAGTTSMTWDAGSGTSQELLAIITEMREAAVDPTILASDSDFVYYGRWGTEGDERWTINNGAEVNFVYTGDSCVLCFDTSDATGFPIIAYQVDGQQWTRATLDSLGNVTITPTYNTVPSGSPPFSSIRSSTHIVRFICNVDDGYPSPVDNWNDQTNAVKFLGIAADDTLVLPTCPNQIEYLGDSITAALRLLYTNADLDGPPYASPETNWTEYVAQALGLRAIVNGHGGQGISTTATDSAPIANDAFGFVYDGKAWSPTIKPCAVVVYMGTNDGSIAQADYVTYLTTIRAAYPDAIIFAIVPFQVTSTRRTNILAAIVTFADARCVSLDYSAAFTVNTDTSDSLHFNPGGAVLMTHQLASDIQGEFSSRGIKVQEATSGGGGLLISGGMSAGFQRT